MLDVAGGIHSQVVSAEGGIRIGKTPTALVTTSMAITATQMMIPVNSDPRESYATKGTILIEDEIITYRNISQTGFEVEKRGAFRTGANPHPAGQTVGIYQLITLGKDARPSLVVTKSRTESSITDNVGIGIVNPFLPLDIASQSGIVRDGADQDIIYIDPIARFRSESANAGIVIGSIGNGRPYISDYGSRGDLKSEGLRFRTSGTTRMIITPNGRVGIGDYSSPSGVSAKLDVAGDVRIDSLSGSTSNVDVQANPNGILIKKMSDLRLKSNISQITGALDKIEQIRGISFEWNEAAQRLGYSTGHKDIGVIAQEVEAVLPELVTTSKDGYKAVNYSNLTAVLIEAVKELKTDNIELRGQIEALKRDKNSREAFNDR
jgi:hypothetical protein